MVDWANLIMIGLGLHIWLYKVPVRDVPGGVAQVRIEKYTHAILYHTHTISYYDVMKYLC